MTKTAARRRRAILTTCRRALLALFGKNWTEHHVQENPRDLAKRLHDDGQQDHSTHRDVRQSIPGNIGPHQNYRKCQAQRKNPFHDHEAAKHRAIEIIVIGPHIPEVALRTSLNKADLPFGQDRSFSALWAAQPHATAEKTDHTSKRYRSQGRISRACLLYTSPSPRDRQKSRMPSSA